jgi:hypothetical protein
MSGDRAGSQGRLTGWRAAIVWLVAASGIVAVGLAQIFNPDAWIVVLIIAAVVASFGLVGAVIVIRLPGNAVGWLVWASGAALGWSAAGVAYGTHSANTCGGCLPATVPVAMLANVSFAPIVAAVGIFIPLLFPDGRLPSPRWRPVAWLTSIWVVMFVAGGAFSPGLISEAVAIENPIGIDAFDGLASSIGVMVMAMLVLTMVLAFVSVVWRFRHADPVQRQQDGTGTALLHQ